VPTGTKSVLLIGGEENNWLYFEVCRTYDRFNYSTKLKTGVKTEQRTPDQSTNARKLSEEKGSGGTVQSDMYENGRRGYQDIFGSQKSNSAVLRII